MPLIQPNLSQSEVHQVPNICLPYVLLKAYLLLGSAIDEELGVSKRNEFNVTTSDIFYFGVLVSRFTKQLVLIKPG